MRPTRTTTLLIAAGTSLALAAPGRAASVVTPVDGATVSALPTFTFDFTKGFADIELAPTPAIEASGSHAGQFSNRTAEVDGFVSGGKLTASDPIDGGTYYWHAQMSDDNDPSNPASMVGPWSAIKRLTVRDEAPHFLGWRVQASPTTHTAACRARVRLRGKLAYEDNDATPRARFNLRVTSGGHLIKTVVLKPLAKDNFDGTVCTRHRTLKITPHVVDRIGQSTRGVTRTVHVHP